MALVDPQSDAVYTAQAFADADGTQPDGEAVQVSSAGRSGSEADPFTFTWPYTDRQLDDGSGDRWFRVTVDEDGSGPGRPVSSSLFGPISIGEANAKAGCGVTFAPCRVELPANAAAGGGARQRVLSRTNNAHLGHSPQSHLPNSVPQCSCCAELPMCFVRPTCLCAVAPTQYW